mmetsp:Transcript_7055/g.20742  ORF Transcript_7055/g.20742 Transcript_7055/m.20742 type:complete len:486 (-) Transcript_7055:688-2145(-)
MLDWLPDFLDGLLNMLSDSNREIRQAADLAIASFLGKIKKSSMVELGPMIGILVSQCYGKVRFNRLTAISWVNEFIELGGNRLIPFSSELLGSIMHCISDNDLEIRQVAGHANGSLLNLVKQTAREFELSPLVQILTSGLGSHHIPTRMAALRWINMLLDKAAGAMNKFISGLLPALLGTLSDEADEVVLTNLEVLARISLVNDEEFRRVLDAILHLFFEDRRLLELRGSLIIRNLCVLLNARSIYISLATILHDTKGYHTHNACSANTIAEYLEFRSIMVQSLSLILLTAHELDGLRMLLRSSADPGASGDATTVFVVLFQCWSHNPVATLALCLTAQAYKLSSALVTLFAKIDITVGFLMQVDKLVQLLESPVFVQLRLQLLELRQPYHPFLLKSLYGLLMFLPQSAAFITLSNRLSTISTLQFHLGGTDATQQLDVHHAELNKLQKSLLNSFTAVQAMYSSSSKPSGVDSHASHADALFESR